MTPAKITTPNKFTRVGKCYSFLFVFFVPISPFRRRSSRDSMSSPQRGEASVVRRPRLLLLAYRHRCRRSRSLPGGRCAGAGDGAAAAAVGDGGGAVAAASAAAASAAWRPP